MILGTDEWAEGKVKIKEMGLPETHPEKEGVVVDLANLEEEVKSRLQRKHQLDEVTQQAGGLKVVDGVEVTESEAPAAAEALSADAAAAPAS